MFRSARPLTLFARTISTSPVTMAPIERITLFKVPNEADRLRLLEQYKVLAKTATKVCPPLLYSSPVYWRVKANSRRTESLISSQLPSANRSTTPGTRASISRLRRRLPRWRI